MNIYAENGMRTVINACGRMTKLGVSAVKPRAAASMLEASRDYVVISELMEWADRRAGELFRCGGGCVCASASSGIFLSLASLFCGDSLGKVKNYHRTVEESVRREVILPMGHDIDYGAPVGEIIRLAGGEIRHAGYANQCTLEDLEAQVSEHTLAVLFVKSHHCVQKDMADVMEVIAFCREKNLPCIVDAAAEEDLGKYVQAGADYVVYSGSKALCGPTSGVVLCREKKASENMLLQYQGVGRVMKIGKEGIMGLMKALEIYGEPEEPKVTREDLKELGEKLENLEGYSTSLAKDAAGREIWRCRIRIEPEKAGYTAGRLAEELEKGNPAVFTRKYLVRQNILEIDPRPLENREQIGEIYRQILRVHRKCREKE